MVLSGTPSKCIEDYLLTNHNNKKVIKFDEEINENKIRLINIQILLMKVKK